MDTNTAETAAPAVATSNAVAVTTPEGFWQHLFAEAAALWHRLVTADEELVSVVKAHPEVVAAATAIEAMAPPEVRAGIDVAEQVADAVNTMFVHVQDAQDNAAQAQGAKAGA